MKNYILKKVYPKNSLMYDYFGGFLYTLLNRYHKYSGVDTICLFYSTDRGITPMMYSRYKFEKLDVIESIRCHKPSEEKTLIGFGFYRDNIAEIANFLHSLMEIRGYKNEEEFLYSLQHLDLEGYGYRNDFIPVADYFLPFDTKGILLSYIRGELGQKRIFPTQDWFKWNLPYGHPDYKNMYRSGYYLRKAVEDGISFSEALNKYFYENQYSDKSLDLLDYDDVGND